MGFSKAEQIIGQFNSAEMQRILPAIQRQAATKKDFILPAPTIKVNDAGQVVLNGVASFKLADSGNVYLSWGEAEASAAKGERIIPQEANGEFPLSRTAERQLAQRTGVHLDFLDKLRTQGQGDLAGRILSERLQRPRVGVDEYDGPDGKPLLKAANGDRYLVRMLDGRVRAVLSDSYRVVDNLDLFFCAAEKLEKVGGEVWQMRLTDDSFSLLAVARGVSGEVRLDRTFDPGDGWQSRWYNEGGDIQYAAMRLSNSETGGGAVNIAPAVMTRVCANFNVWAKTLRAVHLGRKQEEDGLISAETQAAESRVIWLKVRDAIETVFDKERFQAYIDTLNNATQRNIAADVTNATAVMVAAERIAEKYEIGEDRAKALFAGIMQSRDFTQYGVSQALTYQAHDLDRAGAVDTAETLETIGGDVAHLDGAEWRELVKA